MLILFSIFLLSNITIFADNLPQLLWQKVYDSGTHDVAIGLTVDRENNIYITGQTGNDSNWDCLTLKYSSSGEIIWQKVYDSSRHDLGYAVAVDSLENVYVTGQVDNGTNWDYLIIKYDKYGEILWQKTYDGGDLDGGYAICVDNNQNVYVTGQSSSPVTGLNYLTLKYSTTGDLIWQSTYPKISPSIDSYGICSDVLEDGTVNVFLSGYATNGVNHDFLVINYDSINGNPKWIKKYDGGFFEYGQCIVVDRFHNLYVTGQLWDTVTSKWNSFTVKCSSSGTALWKKRYESPENERGFGIVIDTSGFVFVSGVANNGTDDDFLMMKYDSTGTVVWRKIYNTGTLERGYCCGLDSFSNFYITGYFLDSADYDCLTLKYTQQEVTISSPVLNVNLILLDFGEVKVDSNKTMSFIITNKGNGVLSGTITDDKDWITTIPAVFEGNSITVNVTVDNKILKQKKGEHTGRIYIFSNGGSAELQVKLNATCVLASPNPYNPKDCHLKFYGSGIIPGLTTINIYTLSGMLIKKINPGDIPVSDNLYIFWDGKDDKGNLTEDGIYLYTYETPLEKGTGKFTLIKK